jgi:regulator of sigma D
MLQKKIESSSSSHIQHLIQQWLELRKVVLVHYNELCVTKEAEPKTLQKFCQHLMDYISMGHFKMYEKFAEHHENNQIYSKGLNKNLLLNITMNTETVLNFNEKYTEPKSLNALSTDLSQIGEILAHRMDWEDALIKGTAPRYTKGK